MKKKLTTMSFIMADAEAHGPVEAIFLYNLRFWIEVNFKKEAMHKDGLVWMYHTIDQFCDQFPFWTRDQIRHIIKKLKASNCILVGDYSKNRSVRPLWYTMPEYQLQPCGTFTTSEDHVVNVPPVDVVNVPLQGGGKCPTSSTKDNKEKIIHKDNKQEVDAIAPSVVESNSLELAEVKPEVNKPEYPFLKKISKKYHEDVITVLNHWSTTMGVRIDLAKGRKSNADRASVIENMLVDGYVLEDCLNAVTGCLSSPHHMGKNDRGTKYNEIHNIFNHKRGMFDKFIRLGSGDESTSEDGYTVPTMEEFDEINRKFGFGEYADQDYIDVTPQNRITN